MLHQLRVITGIMLVAVLIYAGLWYTAAFQAEKDVIRMLANWRDDGMIVEHGSVKHGGFPYRITVRVDKPVIATRKKGLNVTADSILLLSHLWTPNHWLAEAENLHITAARKSLVFSTKSLLASYRKHEDGKAVVALDSDTAIHHKITHIAGVDDPNIVSWSLYLRFGDTNEQKETGLYGARILDFKANAAWQDPQADATEAHNLVFQGGVSGPIVKDWTKEQLSQWSFDGGLIEIDQFGYAVSGATVTGNASLTLDEQFYPLGSASITISGEEKIYESLGIANIPSLPENLMAQNGSLIAGTTSVMKLKPVIK